MCLYLKEENIIPSVAQKDIICYKVLREYKNKKNPNGCSYRTPFMNCPIVLGTTYGAKEIVNVKDRFIPFLEKAPKTKYTKAVHEGVIHTFKSLRGVKRFLNEFSRIYMLDAGCYAIVKCIIPKGTIYYDGMFEDTGITSYASEQLKYEEEVVYRHQCEYHQCKY